MPFYRVRARCKERPITKSSVLTLCRHIQVKGGCLVGASPYTISRPKWGQAPMTLGHPLPYGVLCVEESVQAKKGRKLMSHNAAGLKGPAPPRDEVMTLWKRLKHL